MSSLRQLPLQDGWAEVVADLRIPDGVVAELRATHPHLAPVDVDRILRGLWQWVRIDARYPGAHELPSAAVEWLWQRCGLALWESLHRDAGLPVPPVYQATGQRDQSKLEATFEAALVDEHPLYMPMLFELDARIHWPGAITYQRCCETHPCRVDHSRVVCLHVPAIVDLMTGDPMSGMDGMP